MALIACPNCGHEVDDSARSCPNCGQQLRDDPVPSDDAAPSDATPAPAAATATERANPDPQAPTARQGAPTPDTTQVDGNAADGDTAEEQTAEAESAPRRGGLAALQWRAVLSGFATILVAEILLVQVFASPFMGYLAIVIGMVVAGSMAREAKFLNALSAALVYFVFGLVVNVLLLATGVAVPADPSGGGGGAPADPGGG